MNETTLDQKLDRDPSGRLLRFADQRSVAALLVLGLVVLLSSRWYGGYERLDEVTEERVAVKFRVDVNRAGQAELGLLPGIGPTLAGRIIRSRQQEGWFLRAAQLQRVRGVGPRKVQQMESYLVFHPPAEEGLQR
ncbi:MAG: helix-hairpin-helix domain-containing protein [Planctomycetaceae bacterium]|nr:helix-hairpin-helix domain-containing protein [Planctomycetaceae bacterium]